VVKSEDCLGAKGHWFVYGKLIDGAGPIFKRFGHEEMGAHQTINIDTLQ
jgi:hypothetical protein